MIGNDHERISKTVSVDRETLNKDTQILIKQQYTVILFTN